MKTNGSRRHLVGVIKALEARNAASDAMLAAAALHHGGEFFIPHSALESITDGTAFAVRSDAGGIIIEASNPKIDDLVVQVID